MTLATKRLTFWATTALALVALAACSPKGGTPGAPPAADQATPPASAPAAPNTAPAGDYVLDKPHASLTFQVNHMGFSHFTGRFGTFDVKLKFDPKVPSAMRVDATIDPKSIAHDNPPAGFLEDLAGAKFLDAGQFPKMAFHSTQVTPTGANTADVTGDMTIHGVTKPVTLHVTFNGGYPGMAMDPHARVGFSAQGSLKRSDFGVAFGVPAPGTTMGVSDQVDVAIEAEFTGPAMAGAPAPKG
jgi:polyisoprenoid-binding protein YceI